MGYPGCKPIGTDPPIVTWAPVVTKSPTGCEDKEKLCPEWAKVGLCTNSKYERYMKVYCKKSCNQCGITCKDLKRECSFWGAQGLCKQQQFMAIMKRDCPKTCNAC